jgi:hypothetical protein
MPNQSELQKRAANFLTRPIPDELKLHYVSGSLADIIVNQCAKAEPLDPELCEMAEMTIDEYDGAIASAKTPELKAYYSECQQLLREILKAAG